MILKIHPVNPQIRHLRKAAEALRNGGLIVYPTDTNYGIGCDLFNKKAVEKLHRVTQMHLKKLFSCILYDFSKLSQYAQVSTWAYRIMRRNLPGPYTFILKGTALLPKVTLTPRKTIGVRMPQSIPLHLLCKEFDGLILSTGVRLSEKEILNDPDEIHKKMGHVVDVVLDAGFIPYNVSTVVSLVQENIEIVRQGLGPVNTLQ